MEDDKKIKVVVIDIIKEDFIEMIKHPITGNIPIYPNKDLMVVNKTNTEVRLDMSTWVDLNLGVYINLNVGLTLPLNNKTKEDNRNGEVLFNMEDNLDKYVLNAILNFKYKKETVVKYEDYSLEESPEVFTIFKIRQ